jgi:hypothetical protein
MPKQFRQPQIKAGFRRFQACRSAAACRLTLAFSKVRFFNRHVRTHLAIDQIDEDSPPGA